MLFSLVYLKCNIFIDGHKYLIILGPNALLEKEKIGLQKVTLRKLNEHLNIFHFGCNMDYYKDCAKRITYEFMRYVLGIAQIIYTVLYI